MPHHWMDVSNLSFNTILLLEEVQLSWLPGWLAEDDLRTALRANPVVEWYLRHKCPALNPWLDGLLAGGIPAEAPDPAQVRQAEVRILQSMTDLVVYAVDPAVYDAQPFLQWDSNELLDMADFNGKTVIDVGAGTGRLALTAAPQAAAVFAVEPVANLRKYLKNMARAQHLANVFAVDGLITDLPFPTGFADITMGGHVFGDDLEGEYRELARVTRAGGMLLLCPGNNDQDNDIHRFLLAHGFAWSRFEEPRDGIKRKYWLRL